jgi:hypothetical protein
VIDPASAGVAKKELNANAKCIADGNWAAQAVRLAIDALIAAAASASIIASSSG